MLLRIQNTGDTPIYQQLFAQLKAAILSGELAEGEALPSIRALARDLRLSVITTKRAYEELEREGYVTTVPGKGSFVAAQNPGLRREERLRQVEEYLLAAIREGAACGLTGKELCELLRLLSEEDHP